MRSLNLLAFLPEIWRIEQYRVRRLGNEGTVMVEGSRLQNSALV
jgi:hypothetical protein